MIRAILIVSTNA